MSRVRRKRRNTYPKKSPRSRPAAVAPAAAWGGRGFWLGLAVVALALRALFIFGSELPEPLPVFSGQIYAGDHDDFVRWGIQAVDRGVLTLYTEPPARQNMRKLTDGQWVVTQRAYDRVCNYPPLSAYLFWISGGVFTAISPERLINTPASSTIFGFWSMVCDILLAAGCAAVVGLYGGPRAVRVAYALALFAPPFWWDSVIWQQMDTVLLAPAVWMLYAMLRERWLLAGVLWGLMLGLKPQAILFVPVWGYALLTVRPCRKPIAGGAAALAVVGIIAMPFMLSSGMAWLDLSYTRNLFGTYSNFVTLKAFNIWYLNVLLLESDDALARVLGLTKSQWGKMLLLVALLAGFAYTIWRWRSDRRGLLVWTALCLLLFVMLPTEVHERYLILALPFLGFIATLTWRAWPGLLLLTVVMMGQLSWPLWLRTEPTSWPGYAASITWKWEQFRSRGEEVRPLEEVLKFWREVWLRDRAQTSGYEWALTAMSLAGAGLSVAVLLGLKPGGNGPVPAGSSAEPVARRKDMNADPRLQS